MNSNWRKVENENGYPFYVNEITNVKQWDHPKFVEIRQKLDECNYVKYSTYRVALKFRMLQIDLNMEKVPLSIIAGVFERHRLGANESSLNLESCDLEAVLSDIFFASKKKNNLNVDVDFSTDLMLNFLYNIFDHDRQRSIQVSSTKIVLSLLSNCTLSELYKFIFSLCADHNNCVTRLRLQSLLSKIVQIAMFLHEDASFGMHLVNTSIENCFSTCPGLVGINESAFISWLDKAPKILSWIPLLHRIKMAETVIHSSKCRTCKTYPLIGLCYKCIKCARYTQCQKCFFTGRTSHNHKLSHSMKEYCTEVNDCGHNVIKKMCGILQCFARNKDNSTIIDPKPFSEKANVESLSNENMSDIEPLSPPQMQLQTIIKQLEGQNRELQQILLLGSHNEKEIRRYLEEHRLHVATHIEKLKILKDQIKTSSTSPLRESQEVHKNIVESTPMVAQGNIRTCRDAGMQLFSPITSIPEKLNESSYENNLDYFSNDDNTTVPYSLRDMSTWIGGIPTSSNDIQISTVQNELFSRKTSVRELHNDLDDALAKLQQILANNFLLDESLGQNTTDNNNLKCAVSEVEDMLSSIIDSVENSRGGSIRSHLKNN